GRARRALVSPLAFYREALEHLAARGVRRDPAETPRALAVRAHARLHGEAASAFDGLTREFEARRYGGRFAEGGGAPALKAWLEALRGSASSRGDVRVRRG